MIFTQNKYKNTEKELYLNKEDLDFFIEKCCQYNDHIFGKDIRYFINDNHVKTRTRISVLSPDPFKCIYNLHVDFQDDDIHVSYDIRFKEVDGSNIPKVHDVHAYYFANNTIHNLPIEEQCPDIHIFVDDEVNIAYYSLNYRHIINEYDDHGDFSNYSQILDFEFFVRPNSIDFELLVNYHCDKNSEDYALIKLANLKEKDLIKLDYFLRLMHVSDATVFPAVFEYTKTSFISVAEIKTIFDDVILNFDQKRLDENFLLYSMAKI